ncbi:MAG: FG-GAP-like repeat-containing protein [Bacteroidales bacterium]|nr:FG-GAP-like repeat-containing protein [Bacteroidales bacterium]
MKTKNQHIQIIFIIIKSILHLLKKNISVKKLFFFSIILVSFFSISFIINNNSKLNYRLPCCISSIFSADIDLDGDNDLITGHATGEGYSDTAIVILNNYGNGYFNQNYNSFQYTGYQYEVFAVDLNSNNYPDIVSFYTDVTSGVPIRYIRVLYNNYGTFGQFADFPMNISEPVWAKTYGDIDGDNDVDIMIASSPGYKWGIMTNDGSGILSAPEYYDMDYAPVDIECSDMNNDNLKDIIIAGTDNTLFLNTGLGFQEMIFEWSHLQEVEIDDFNNDGINDIVGIESFWNTSLFIYENNWDTTFTKHTALVYDSVLYNPVVGDINNDSLPDVICTSFSGVFVLKNNGDYTLKLPDYYPFPISCYVAGYAYCSDLNNDGCMDITAVLHHPTELSTQLMTLFNDGTGHFVQTPVTEVENPKQKFQNPILKCFPNPFHKKVTILVKIENKTKATVRITELTGREIKTLQESTLKPGEYEFHWDGTNNTGQMCPNGLYFVLLETEQMTETKIILFN